MLKKMTPSSAHVLSRITNRALSIGEMGPWAGGGTGPQSSTVWKFENSNLHRKCGMCPTFMGSMYSAIWQIQASDRHMPKTPMKPVSQKPSTNRTHCVSPSSP